jgi:hypothetical protein
MIDRLVHHAEILALKGDSCRLKDRDLARAAPSETDPRPRRAGGHRRSTSPSAPASAPIPDRNPTGGCIFNRRTRVQFQPGSTS